MLIEYFSHSYFKISGKEFSICLDPFKDIGLPVKKCTANYLHTSHNHYDHNNKSAVKCDTVITNSDDNFKIIPTYHDNQKGALRGENNVLLFTLDGKKVAHLGDIGEYNEKVVNLLKGIDLLFIPVGGVYTIDSEIATKYVENIKAKVVVPMHFKVQNCSVEVDSVDKFLKGKNYIEKEYSFVLEDVINNKEQIIYLKPQI